MKIILSLLFLLALASCKLMKDETVLYDFVIQNKLGFGVDIIASIL